MKTIIPSDRNTFFNVRREHLQSLRHPLKRGNTIPESYKDSGVYYDEKSWQPFPRVYGGAGQTQTGYSSDKNIFFQVPIRQEPFLRKRVIKDLEPGSRVVGQLAITKKERDAENMLKGINALGTLLTNFLSAPVVDPVTGVPIIDPITNKPVMQKRSLHQVLEVTQATVRQLFKDLSIPVSPTMNIVMNGLSIQNTQNVVNRTGELVKALPNITIADRNALVKRVTLNERMDTDIENPEEVAAVIAENSEQKISTGDEKDDYIAIFRGVITPRNWVNMSNDQKGHLKSYIIERQKLMGVNIRKADGTLVVFFGRARALGEQFQQGESLDTIELEFFSRPLG